jgi:quercetin dioxygenase-like cupin family protein
MKFTNLMREELETAEGLEVVVSLVEIPPNTRLPVHTHPGEEFAYVIEGALVLWQQGKDDIRVKAGDADKVALNQVHTTFTEDEGAKVLVFRVHTKGAPERILVDG